MVKKIMVIGSTGMAGHLISSFFKHFPDQYDVFDVSRDDNNSFQVNIEEDLHKLTEAITEYRPDFIINCIGLLVKASNDNPCKAVFVNGTFPHWLEYCTARTDCKIIHLSTDCIFDGNEGNYEENSFPTERNWYGRSKAIGELNNSKDLTLRMSIIGPELKRKTALLEWVLAQKTIFNGFVNVSWNGITTLELAKQIKKIIETAPYLSGIYNLVPDFTISKYELAKGITNVFETGVDVIKFDEVVSNKTLVNTRKTEYIPNIPSYRQQLVELKKFYYD